MMESGFVRTIKYLTAPNKVTRNSHYIYKKMKDE